MLLFQLQDYSSDSDTGSDSFLQDDIHAISQACFPAPTPTPSPHDDDDDDDLELLHRLHFKYGDITNTNTNTDNDNDDDSDDDFKTLLSVQARFSDHHTHYLDHPHDDDDDDDFKTLLSIQARFSGHNTHHHESVDDPHDDDDDDNDDDFKTLHSIQARFSDHNTHHHDPHDDDDDDDDFKTLMSIRHKYSDPSNSHAFDAMPHDPLISLRQAITNNRSSQKFIRDKLLHLKAIMEKNNHLRKRLKTLRDYQIQCRKKAARAFSQKHSSYVHLFSPRAHTLASTTISNDVSPMSYGPLDNAQVVCSKAAFSRFPVTFHRKKWTNKESGHLRKGLVQQCQEMLFQRMADDANGSVGVDDMVSKVAGHVITPETIQGFCVSGKVNWERLALVSVPGRSGAECEARWFNFENSLINKSMWAAEEEKKLLGIILGRKGKQVPRLHDWNGIATQLGTNRTPYQCLLHFQRSLNPNLLKRAWTEAEDGQLRTAVEELGVNDWQAVASRLERRNGIQCSDRWRKYLDPVRTRVGRWVEDEDKRLKIAVNFLGKRWARVAQFVPGRTDVQCRERWENVFDPGMRLGQWSKKEDLLLKAAVAKHGSSCWSKVAACLGARTDNQCWRRWKMLFPRLAVEARAARIVQKVALPSNFVGRKWERPCLGAKDFSLSVPNHVAKELTTSKGRRSLKRKRSTRNCGSKQTSRGESTNGAPKSKKRSSECTELDESTDLQGCKIKESVKTTERDSYESHNYGTRSRRRREVMVKRESG